MLCSNRVEELAKITRFMDSLSGELKHVLSAKIGDINQYINFNHFSSVVELAPRLYPSSGWTDGKLGVIHIPMFDDYEYNNIIEVSKIIHEIDVTDWIVDLRGNGGGGVLHLMCALAALLPDEYQFERFKCENGKVTLGNHTFFQEVPIHKKKKVDRLRVIVDDSTCSAAEMIAIILQRCAGGELIGSPTCRGINYTYEYDGIEFPMEKLDGHPQRLKPTNHNIPVF